MVSTADFAVFQQQLRQEMTDVMQQLRTEMNETVNGRMDMLNSINTALQNVSTKTTDFKPYRISDLIQEIGKAATKKENSEVSCQTCTYGCKHGQTRVSESWRELRALTRLIAQLAVDCTKADFRTFVTALYQVLRRTTANEPLRMIQQVEGQ